MQISRDICEHGLEVVATPLQDIIATNKSRSGQGADFPLLVSFSSVPSDLSDDAIRNVCAIRFVYDNVDDLLFPLPQLY